jgi:hypothetical protein
VPLAVGGVLLALLTVGAARLVTTAAASTAGATAVSLVDDDGGAALFSAAGLSPGQVQAACVGLTAGGSADPTTEVGLTADVAPGGLAPFLQVWVEEGGVPAGGSCGSFSGALVWSGTLAGFPATGTAGIATGWRPALTGHSVYRFTVRVLDDPRAQDLRTSATFRWSFTEAAPPPVAPIPEPTAAPPPATPTSAPRSTPPSLADAPTISAEAPAASAAPSTGPPPAPPVPVATGRARAVVQAPPMQSGPVAAVQAALVAAGEAVKQVGRTAVAVAHNGQYPVALIAVVAAFLFLQGRLDRRDPKLALARVREELFEFREFPEPPPTETT